MTIVKIIEIILISMALSVDCFAVSISEAAALKKVNKKEMFKAAVIFSFSHLIALFLGYFLGKGFKAIIYKADHWIAFTLLIIVSISMIKEMLEENKAKKEEAFEEEKRTKKEGKIKFKELLMLSLALGINALAIGIVFALDYSKIESIALMIILPITVIISSLLGFNIGERLGKRYSKSAKLISAVVLILIAFKTIIEHIVKGI